MDLSLSQGDGGEFLGEPHLFGKLVQVSGRVSASRQHEDERSGGGGFFKHGRQVSCLKYNKKK
jgi:hypothetical protein